MRGPMSEASRLRSSIVDAEVVHLGRGGQIAPVGERKLIAATWSEVGTLLRFEGRYLDISSEPDLIYVESHAAPIKSAHDDYSLAGQLGMLLHAEFKGGRVEMIGQLGHNAAAEALWRDLVAGINFGCSICATFGVEVPITDLPVALDMPAFRLKVGRSAN